MSTKTEMQTITSVSGGKSSAYIAAHFPADHLLFALVRIEDKRCQFPDKKLRQMVEDRIQAPFIATPEQDTIIHTIFDLEQYIGQKINWVTGPTFEQVIKAKSNFLPNRVTRYCTTILKIEPMFRWWYMNIEDPIQMQIGFRGNEQSRAIKMQDKLNDQGLSELKISLSRHTKGSHKGKKKWEYIAWQKPVFPLVENGIFKDDIDNYWRDKPVRFAQRNNCIGCFWRGPMLLKQQQQLFSNKFRWFADQETKVNGSWREDVSYRHIEKWQPQISIDFTDERNFSDCDSGYCGF